MVIDLQTTKKNDYNKFSNNEQLEYTGVSKVFSFYDTLTFKNNKI